MRMALMSIALLMACSGTALSDTRYDVYVFQSRDGGPHVYAFSGGERAVALEVSGCNQVRVLPNAAALASELSARRDDDNTSVITVSGRGTQFGPCAEDDEAAEAMAAEDEEALQDRDDSLVVIENASARQTRHLIATLDAAPQDVRNELIATLGLR